MGFGATTNRALAARKCGLPVLVLLPALLLAAGCSADPAASQTPTPGESSPAGSPEPSAGPTTPATRDASKDDSAAPAPSASPAPVVWSSSAARPVSDVASVAGRPLVVATVDTRLEIQALDAATGKVAWAHRVTSSLVSPQVPMPVTALGNRYVAVLEPLEGGGQRARMQFLDVTKGGARVAGTGIYQFTGFPQICTDDAKSVCARAVRGTKAVEVRMRPGVAAKERPIADGGDSYQDMEVQGLVRFLDPATRIMSIGVEQGSKLLWKKNEKELFGKLSAEGGWHFRQEGDVIYGSVQLAGARPTDPMPTRYLGIGLDARTGRVLWRQPGADLGCSTRTDVVLGCIWQEGFTRRSGVVENGRLVVSRIDPANGKKLWTTRPMFVKGRNPSRLGDAGTGVVLAEGTGRTHIDATTGQTRPATATDTAWTKVRVDVPSAEPWFRGSTRMDTRSGEVNQVSPVTRTDDFHLPIPATVGAQFGPVRLLSLPGRIVALRTAG